MVVEMRGYVAFGGAKNRTPPAGAPLSHGRYLGSDSLAGLPGAPLLFQPTPSSAGPARTVVRSPQGGAASPPQERQWRQAGAASRAAPDPWARPGAGSSSHGISFSISVTNPRLEALAFYLRAALLNSLRPQGRGASGGAWFRECPAHFSRGLSEDGSFASLPGLESFTPALRCHSASGRRLQVREPSLLSACPKPGYAERSPAPFPALRPLCWTSASVPI